MVSHTYRLEFERWDRGLGVQEHSWQQSESKLHETLPQTDYVKNVAY